MSNEALRRAQIEADTHELFALDVVSLSQQLQNVWIEHGEVRIQISSFVIYTENDKQYKKVKELQPGVYLTAPVQGHDVSLITAKADKVGSPTVCVKLDGAVRKGIEIKPAHIIKHLGLDTAMTREGIALYYHKDAHTLYLDVKAKTSMNEEPEISPEDDAATFFRGLLGDTENQ